MEAGGECHAPAALPLERARSWVLPRASLDRHGKDKISYLHWDWNPTPSMLVLCCYTNYCILGPSHIVTDLKKLKKKIEFVVALIGIMFMLICFEICPAVSLEACR